MMDRRECCALGKALYFDRDRPTGVRMIGWDYLCQAYRLGSVEAKYLMGYAAYVNPFEDELSFREELPAVKLSFDVPMDTKRGYRMICSAADEGSIHAKNFLDRDSDTEWQKRFQRRVNSDVDRQKGSLKDFDGKELKIRRTGLLTPVDMVLEYRDGRNVVTISTNVHFVYWDSLGDQKNGFEKAVIEGIKAWEGAYSVFGGQQLDVKVRVTQEERKYDNLTVSPCTETWEETFVASRAMMDKIPTLRDKGKDIDLFSGMHAHLAFKWSVTARKVILIRPEDGSFKNMTRVKHIMKHEFGHALGLGDLYRDSHIGLSGVPQGKYRDLDPYYLSDGKYDLVMCDPYGRISNNDMEMVLLAFSENRLQSYQMDKSKGEVSKALGKGD